MREHVGWEKRPLVLHLRTVSSVGGGPEKTITNSPRYLAEHGYGSACIYLHPPNDPGIRTLQQLAAQREAPLIAVEDRGAVDLRSLRNIGTLVTQMNPAIIHAHDYKTNAMAILLRRRFSGPVLTTEHGWGVKNWKLALYYSLDRRLLRYFDHVFCVSQDIVEKCRQAGVPAQRCTLLDNGIALDEYAIPTSAVRHAARAELRLPQDLPLLAAVGRLSDEKGFDHLIRAVALLSSRNMHLHLAIAGSGSDQSRLMNLVIESGLQDHVTLLGHLLDVRTLYQAADMFVLSSLREGLPNVVLEAMAMRLPVVATDVGGVARLVCDRKTGLLVPPRSPEALANAIHTFCDDRGFAERCAVHGREKVETEFSFATRIEKVVAVYDRLLNRRRQLDV